MSTAGQTVTGQNNPPDTKIGGRKADQAYRIMKRAIVLHQYPPETQLLEQNIAREFGCSQGTVREALLRLADDGLVERRGYRGTIVTQTSIDEVCEMVRVRLSIERRAARMICRLSLDDVKAVLDTLLIEMDEAHAAEDFFRCSELDRAYHAEVARIAGLGLLSPVLRRCALHIHRFTLSNIEVPRDFSRESGIGHEHRALLAELTCGSPDRSELAITAHLQGVLERWAPSVYAAVGQEAFEAN